MYRRRSFDADIIELCVRWYITYRLSYRDLVAMMAERGVEISDTTILRWVVFGMFPSSRSAGVGTRAASARLGG
jgi:hypothetical protein